jgi:hypothetical protein
MLKKLRHDVTRVRWTLVERVRRGQKPLAHIYRPGGVFNGSMAPGATHRQQPDVVVNKEPCLGRLHKNSRPGDVVLDGSRLLAGYNNPGGVVCLQPEPATGGLHTNSSPDGGG